MKHTCLKEFIWYASLNVLGMIGLSCYILADTFFVAQGLGSTGLAALNLAIPVYSFIPGSGLMIGMGGATRYSILQGQKKSKESSIVFSHTLMLLFAFAILFILTGLCFSKPLTLLLGADSATFEMCRTYLRILLLFSPLFLLNDSLLCFVRNDGAPQLAMIALTAGSLSNIVLDYIFIFPLGMGIFGAVLATSCAPVISLLILSTFFLRKRNHFHIVAFKPAFTISKLIFSTGVPSLVTEVSSGIVIIVFNIIILGLSGNSGVAAYGVIANLSLVIIAIYTGIAQGMQPLVSRYFGFDSKYQIRLILRYASITVALLSALIYFCVFFWADGITAIFNREQDAALQAIAVPGLRIYFLGCMFAGLNIVLCTYLSCTDHVKPANILSLLRGFLIILPLAFLLAALGGMTGLWAVFPTTEFLVFLMAWIVIKKHSYRL